MFKRNRFATLCGALALVAAAVLVFSALAGTGAEAARGGNGKGNGHSQQSTAQAWITAEPNPAEAGSVVRVTGCGFYNDGTVEVHVQHNGTTDVVIAFRWADGGCIDFPYVTSEVGAYKLSAFQYASRTLSLMAEGTLQVQ